MLRCHLHFVYCKAANLSKWCVLSSLSVMPQRYAVEMHDEFVLKGNTAVLKCHVPGFVKDYVIVEAWIKEPMEKVDANSKSSKKILFWHCENISFTATKHWIRNIENSLSLGLAYARIFITIPFLEEVLPKYKKKNQAVQFINKNT